MFGSNTLLVGLMIWSNFGQLTIMAHKNQTTRDLQSTIKAIETKTQQAKA